jgi:hypothetical protein
MPNAASSGERFLAAYIQRSRERGEQILLAGWRLPSGAVEAFVFLLDWRGGGLRDFYRTRSISDDEWQTLVDHNAGKGAPMVEISLGEAIALVQAALAESARYSRPAPREYKLETRAIERRMPAERAAPAPIARLIGAHLTPAVVVAAYVAALHHRDFTLATELLAASHPLRADRMPEEAVVAVRAAFKSAPRREEQVRVELPDGTDRAVEGAARVALTAFGAQVATDPGGRRIRAAVVERYQLVRAGADWRIAEAHALA